MERGKDMLVQHRHARTISASRFAFGASLLAIALAQPAQAQSAEAPPSPAATAGSTSAQSGSPVDSSNDIIITGTRQSLANAQTIKRNSDTIVDAITADDIGSLPDRSVNEALQRIPGVAISRFASPSDSQHYSAQGSGVAIRGLSYVRGEFNGRDTFAVGAGREIGFNDVPAELVGSVDVFKNATADLIEGGIAGTVNINQRKPFDSKKSLFFLSAGMNYGDLERRSTPQGVALFSKQWDLPFGGRLGVLGSVTYQQLRTRSDSVFLSSYLPRYNDDKNGNGVQDTGEGRVINAGTAYQATLFDTYPVPSGFDHVYVPLGAGSRTQDFDRKRLGFAGGLQYENDRRNLLITAQFLRADSREEWLEHTVEPNVYYGDVTTVFPVGNTPPTYDSNGIFTSGTLGKVTGAVFGNSPTGYGALNQFAPNGVFTTESNRHFYTRSITQDQSLNIRWEPTDRLKLNFDGQYVKSKLHGNDDILDTATFSQSQIDLRGKIPQITSITPGFDTAAYFADPQSLYFRDAFNNLQRNDGHEWAFRTDAEYDLSDVDFLRSVRVGGRFSDRKQTVRTNDYNNWGYVSETWGGPGPVGYAKLGQGSGQLYQFDNFFRGEAVTPPDTNFVPSGIVSNHAKFEDLLRRATALGGGAYTPPEDRHTSNGDALVDGIFLPSEVYRNREKTWAGYVRADFGLDTLPAGMKLSGNVGVRFVHTEDVAFGALTVPQNSQILPVSNDVPPLYTDITSYCAYSAAHPNGQGTIPAICTVPASQQAAILAFANGASTSDVARQKYNDWLPSLNLKLQITDKLAARLAASRAISRPNFGSLRNYLGVNVSGGNTSGVFGFSATAQNPYLRPIKATQLDGTLEWYFANVGSLTGAVFYKDLTNIILDNAGYTRTVTNNGQSFDVAVNGPANAKGHGKIKGFELAYQQTYDFLPGVLKGLGLQATYTYISPSHIPNSPPANGPSDGSRPPLDVTGIYNTLPLAGLSRHNFNVNAFYDYGGFDVRVAYSWRSRYLLTNRDCCFPFLPVYALSTGQMDASIFYTVNKFFKIGIQGQNLLDELTRTSFVLNSQGLQAPRSYFRNDRTFLLAARITY